MRRNCRRTTAFGLIMVLAASGLVGAQISQPSFVEDFETRTAGSPICGQGDWANHVTFGGCEPYVVEAGDTKTLRCATANSAAIYTPVAPQVDSVELLWRWRADVTTAKLAFGPVNPDAANPGDWADYRVRVLLNAGEWGCRGDVWHDNSSWPACQAGVWYRMRLHLDFSANTFSLYVTDLDAGSSEIELVAGAAMAGTGPCETIMIKGDAGSGDVVLDDIEMGLLSDGGGTAEDYSEWLHHRDVHFNTTADGAAVDSSVSDFPVLLRLDGTVLDFAQVQPGGADLRFADPDGTPLSYEVERWDATHGEGLVWVRVPQVDGASSDDYIIMYWGRSDAPSRSDGSAVFGGTGHAAVWHLDETGLVDRLDATGAGNDAVAGNYDGDEGVEGLIGGVDSLEGGDEHLVVQNPGVTDGVNSALTLSAWIKPESSIPDWSKVFCKRDDADSYYVYTIQFDRDSGVLMCVDGQNGGEYPVSFGEWHHVVGVYDGGEIKLYVDGALRTVASRTGPLSASSAPLFLGNRSESSSHDYIGILDEMSVAARARSAAWVKLAFENQRPGSAFVSFGTSAPRATIAVEALVGTVAEDTAATEAFVVTAALSSPATYAMEITVPLTSSGTATSGEDYLPLPLSAVVFIPADSLSGRSVGIWLEPIDDEEDEGVETVVLRALPDTTYDLGVDSATVLLGNDDEVVPPSIHTHPLSATVLEGDVVVMGVAADGSRPLAYQWRRGYVDIAGAHDSLYTTPPLLLDDDSTLFDCIVSNAAGADTSLTAMVNVGVRPEPVVIQRHPSPVSAVLGDTVAFVCDVAGTPPFGFSWSCDTGTIDGATDSVLVIGPVTLDDNGREYTCETWNSVDTVISRAATLTVSPPSSRMIEVSGDLYSDEGAPVGYGGTRTMDFVVRLYPSAQSNTAVYTEYFLDEERRGVRVSDGKFSLRLGSGRSGDNLGETVRENPNLFVSFAVSVPGGNPESLEPRTPLTASPYALSGISELIKGSVDPGVAQLEAPIGTHYLETGSGKTYVKTHNSWVEIQ